MQKVLIANRGEVVSRVARTLAAHGHATVGVYTVHDAQLPYTRHVDECVAVASYLDASALVAAARATQCTAVHPGWGFLAESAAFARAVQAAGLVWIGPRPAAMEALGDKQRCREAASALVPPVPVVPGGGGDAAQLRALAEQLGWPVLLKAVGGGGGRGQRAVTGPHEWDAALSAASAEALATCGDGALLVERLVARARHVEVQVAGDSAGALVALGTRDCSAQRRRQKVVEECPAPGVDAALGARLCDDAVRLCASAAYHTLGTVEFLVDAASGAHYLLEVNARLQVEHTVTEEVWGVDLVHWQLLLALGRPVAPLALARPSGHALQLRVCAEDAQHRPSAGALTLVRWPAGCRVEAGVEVGSVVSPHYDSMVAKLVVRGPTREAVLAAARVALGNTLVLGPTCVTNVPTLLALVSSAAFVSNTHHTAWLDALAPVAALPVQWVAAALLGRARHGFRSNAPVATLPGRLVLVPEGGGAAVRVTYDGQRVRVGEAEHAYTCALPHVTLDGVTRALDVATHGDAICVQWGAHAQWRGRTGDRLAWAAAAQPEAAAAADGDELGLCRMPGTVKALLCAEAETVARGQPLVALESMKMELVVAAPRAGRVAYLVQPGQAVEAGSTLFIVK